MCTNYQLGYVCNFSYIYFVLIRKICCLCHFKNYFWGRDRVNDSFQYKMFLKLIFVTFLNIIHYYTFISRPLSFWCKNRTSIIIIKCHIFKLHCDVIPKLKLLYFSCYYKLRLCNIKKITNVSEYYNMHNIQH